jgi:hypothetical protein
MLRGIGLNMKVKGFAKRETINHEGEKFCQEGEVTPCRTMVLQGSRSFAMKKNDFAMK